MDFEVIEIVDESSPYPALLGIDWAADMNGVINLRKRKMIFEKNSLRVVIPLDPVEGPHYTELMRNEGSDDELDCIYKITARNQEWVNLIAEARISWGHAESCIKDSDEEDEYWHNQLNGVTTLNYNMMTKSLYCVRAQDRELPMYDGLTTIDEFLTKFEITVPEHQWFNALRWALRATPARWWGTHEGTFDDWRGYRRMMQIRFGKPELRITENYDGRNDLACTLLDGSKPMEKSLNRSGYTYFIIPWMSFQGIGILKQSSDMVQANGISCAKGFC